MLVQRPWNFGESFKVYNLIRKGGVETVERYAANLKCWSFWNPNLSLWGIKIDGGEHFTGKVIKIQ